MLLRVIFLMYGLVFCFIAQSQQVANYVTNGSFEAIAPSPSCNPFGWQGIDSINDIVVVSNSCNGNSPFFGFSYQNPRTGLSSVFYSFYFPSGSFPFFRSYYRNQLKSQLVKDEVYCVQFYVSIGNNSTFGIDAIEAHFTSGIGLDTINYGHLPLTYLIPQVRNPKGNIITDTLNWTLVTGTFKANGAEKYMVIGNFESDANTDTMLLNPTNLPLIFCEISLDDVSCIPIDLPAYAGPDRRFLPGESIYLGRERDVGIDEACVWYQWPNMTTPIDTAAGIWVSLAQTSTYIVRQEICGNVKFDTVVVYQDHVGIEKIHDLEKNVILFPQPGKEIVQLKIDGYTISAVFDNFLIYDQNLRIVQQGEISDKEEDVTFDVSKLTSGIYSLRLFNTEQTWSVSKRLLVTR